MNKTVRCDWALKNELEQRYHDEKWGKIVHDDKELFKMLILEGKQSGLSWLTILKKMDTLCEAFDDFDPEKLVNYDDEKIEKLLQNDGIIRNRLKVKAVIENAKVYFKIIEEFGSFDKYIWKFTNNKVIVNNWESIDQVPSRTSLSDEISKDMKKRGFKFVGTTTVYAFMQAIGMVNDHLLKCSFRNLEKQ